MGNLQTRVNEEEEEKIRLAMHLAGAKNMSEYIKMRLLHTDGINEESLGKIAAQLDGLTERVDSLAKSIRSLSQAQSDDLTLKLLAGIFLLLHPSVDTGVQAVVNEYLDVKGVEHFLKTSKKGRT